MQLTRDQARRIAVRAQRLDEPRPSSPWQVVRDLTLLWVDPTSAIAPSADLVLWSRLGSAYDRDDLTVALEQRTLVELPGVIRPGEDMALYRAEMRAYAAGDPLPARDAWRDRGRKWVAANDACRRDLLRRLDSDGPMTSRELPDTCAVPWQSTGWTNSRNVNQLLELMVRRGEVALDGRRGRERLWNLAERVYPDDEAWPLGEAYRERARRRLASLGIARERGAETQVEPVDVGAEGVTCEVDGVRGQWRVDPDLFEAVDEPLAGRVALMSPFDLLVHDRKRMLEILDFDYQLEMYKPAAKRRFGYYALPVLVDDRLVGKLDASVDRKAGLLRIHAMHEDSPWDEVTRERVLEEVAGLGRWLGLPVDM